MVKKQAALLTEFQTRFALFLLFDGFNTKKFLKKVKWIMGHQDNKTSGFRTARLEDSL